MQNTYPMKTVMLRDRAIMNFPANTDCCVAFMIPSKITITLALSRSSPWPAIVWLFDLNLIPKGTFYGAKIAFGVIRMKRFFTNITSSIFKCMHNKFIILSHKPDVNGNITIGGAWN